MGKSFLEIAVKGFIKSDIAGTERLLILSV